MDEAQAGVTRTSINEGKCPFLHGRISHEKLGEVLASMVQRAFRSAMTRTASINIAQWWRFQ